MKLIFVDRGEDVSVHLGVDTTQQVMLINSARFVFDEASRVERGGTFFLVDDRDVARSLAQLAKKNPGYPVLVFGHEQEAICPAGEMITKQITKEGTLPA